MFEGTLPVRLWSYFPPLIREQTGTAVGNAAIAILLAGVGLAIPIDEIPSGVRALMGGGGWLLLWGLMIFAGWVKERRLPYWRMSTASIRQGWPRTEITQSLPSEQRVQVNLEVGPIAVRQSSVALERAEIVWRTWPLLIPGRVKWRIPLSRIQGPGYQLPLSLYNRTKGDPMYLHFDEHIHHGVHDDPPRHSRLFLALTVGGRTKETCVATVKMRDWTIDAEITAI